MPLQVLHTAISLFLCQCPPLPQPGKVHANVSFSLPSLPLPRPPPPVVKVTVGGPLIVDGVDFATMGLSPVAGVGAAMTEC